ncbi:fatty acid desaturase family protein [Agilicoccus flavus]|uniref:fatty acid desaturase family protein n=1 Tax=Agilicoccus flavus TaxID=2775968 RepID=UPI001CF60700|nr:acyl-CoA desaturase [Agilicoccus flavus]
MTATITGVTDREDTEPETTEPETTDPADAQPARTTDAAPTTPTRETRAGKATRRPARASAATTERHWKPKRSGGADPAGHLTPAQIDALGRELDALRDEVMATRGAADAAYIRRLITVQRGLELGSRLVLLGSKNKAAWVAGTLGLTAAKILENMEIGHNVMHGQWDWMRDPKIHSSSWEWDHAATAAMWKHSHNEVHHTYTNVVGRDNDLGYGILRVDADQKWHPAFLAQPIYNIVNAITFQYSIALYDLELGRHLKYRKRLSDQQKTDFVAGVRAVAAKTARHVARDYVVHPALSGTSWRSTAAANFTANLVRNLWTNTVIVCGHFPDGVETFAKASIRDETRGEWYLRQMLGSANISGPPAMHLATGNLSHQIEHHMFPDLPSNRYAEVAVRVREIFDRYDLPYVTGPLHTQYLSVWRKVIRYSLPNGAWEDLREQPVPTLRRGLSWLGAQVRGSRRHRA